MNAGSRLPASRYQKCVVGYLFTPPCCPSHRRGYCTTHSQWRSTLQITNKHFPPEVCAAPPGQEGATGDDKGRVSQFCSGACLLLSPHPAGWPFDVGVPMMPRSAGRRPSLLLGAGHALAPLSPPRSLSSKAPRLVKPLLCAPLM